MYVNGVVFELKCDTLAKVYRGSTVTLAKGTRLTLTDDVIVSGFASLKKVQNLDGSVNDTEELYYMPQGQFSVCAEAVDESGGV